MPINKEVCKRFSDTWAAPGSQLYAALEAGDRKKAEAIYNECEDVNRKLEVSGARRPSILVDFGPIVIQRPWAVVRYSGV